MLRNLLHAQLRVHLDGVFAFLDVLLRCPTVIIKRHHPFGGPRQVGDNKADAGAQLAGVPFHLGHHAPLPVPTSSLIPEAGVIAPHMVRRTTDGAGQQVGNAFLKNLVLRQPDRVEKTLTFQELVDVRCGKGGVPSEVAAQVPFPITLNDRFQNLTPTVGTVDIAGAKGTPLQIARQLVQGNRGW